MTLFRELASTLTALVYPQVCPECGHEWRDGAGWLCNECWDQLPPGGSGIWIADSYLRGRIFVAVHYGDAARRLVHQMKFYGRDDIAARLGEVSAKRYKTWSVVPPLEAVVPVPLHPARIRERGFDQNYYIVRSVAAIMGLPLRTNLIRRHRHTPAQSRLSDTERRVNLHEAFSPAPGRLAHIPKYVLLVDDVIHTGATLKGGVEALLAAGVEEVAILAACG